MSELDKPTGHRLELKWLLLLQALYSVASITYLLISGYLKSSTGTGLSAAPVVFSLSAFAVYSCCLFLPRFGHIKFYRIAMIPALLIFGGGGVIGNILSLALEGLARYASLTAWGVGVAINTYGTLLNIIAAFGWFRSPNR
ncbi:hypothetical protein SAMN02745181_2627 [Rubritalea squalenifaciens DSM 18772]|uniref:Uncharacterized protein n=1 Tax=Rubritalea squalenifaciens DSM 18772 TaxID=1123071 RepID=A0A1M6M738_9BACT|nr:hypothetical protein [Rubritalea squalenifaciens]SHJ79237.1 hypothetical protein SAMN02745181_2627 [Rubritalea squalenifaciens DSM 18772]